MDALSGTGPRRARGCLGAAGPGSSGRAARTPAAPWARFSAWLECVCVVTFDLELGQALEVSGRGRVGRAGPLGALGRPALSVAFGRRLLEGPLPRAPEALPRPRREGQPLGVGSCLHIGMENFASPEWYSFDFSQ
ncbi:uncharacterized protein LOC113221291 [Piliocolobus tephrosceles]|uniref:uncharacterized protein LOC113221291 n=1 Tax=Piliocolobus tephrosceles TaxID=591936 RepID=UPI000E6B19C3|nr:uncharacterized protein LOC113221291 [Piliocolobus tephrosceles]